MVSAALEKDLTVEKEDAIGHLEKLEPDSLGGIFSSQVIEHLKPRDVLKLIELSHQKLKPGAYFIAETLNPQCLTVLNNNFAIDLSHEKPIHPQTLRFFVIMIGFKDVEVVYKDAFPKDQKLKIISVDKKLSKDEEENIGKINDNTDRLNELLFGYQNYAVIGKKTSSND